VGLVVSLGAVFGAVPAGAGGPGNEVTFSLSCDKGVTATVSATFVTNSEGGAGVFGLTGVGRRQSVPLPQAETAIVVTQFDVTASDGTVSCADPLANVALPARLDCGGARSGAKLTVR
jgi:hypothetical protein